MPLYDFINTETDEVVEMFFSYDKKVEWMKENPHMVEKFSVIHYGDPFVHKPPKPDSDYNSMLKKMKKFYDRKGNPSSINTW